MTETRQFLMEGTGYLDVKIRGKKIHKVYKHEDKSFSILCQPEDANYSVTGYDERQALVTCKRCNTILGDT